MRSRPQTVIAGAALAALLLAGCGNSNVGQAASVNGQRISESDVNRYVSARAEPVSVPDQSGASTVVAPRTFVVEILVFNRILRDLLAKTPQGVPAGAELAQLKKSVLAGKSAKAVANAQGVKGFSTAFDRELVRQLAFGAALRDRQQKGADINKLTQRLHVRVSLSPRYGRWNAKSLSIDTRAEAGVPSFVTLQPTPTGSASAALTNP